MYYSFDYNTSKGMQYQVNRPFQKPATQVTCCEDPNLAMKKGETVTYWLLKNETIPAYTRKFLWWLRWINAQSVPNGVYHFAGWQTKTFCILYTMKKFLLSKMKWMPNYLISLYIISNNRFNFSSNINAHFSFTATAKILINQKESSKIRILFSSVKFFLIRLNLPFP